MDLSWAALALEGSRVAPRDPAGAPGCGAPAARRDRAADRRLDPRRHAPPDLDRRVPDLDPAADAPPAGVLRRCPDDGPLLAAPIPHRAIGRCGPDPVEPRPEGRRDAPRGREGAAGCRRDLRAVPGDRAGVRARPSPEARRRARLRGAPEPGAD